MPPKLPEPNAAKQPKSPLPVVDPAPRKKKNGKKSSLLSPGIAFLLVLSVILALYGHGDLPFLDTLINSIYSAINSQQDGLSLSFRYGIMAAVAVIALIIVARIRKKMQKAARKAQRERLADGRAPVSESEFIEMAAANGVSAQVAKTLYRELKPSYAAGMPLRITDNFVKDLHWPKHKIEDFMWNLPAACGRKKHVLADPTTVHTVLEMLVYLESCPGPKRD
jgi:hypothetical protein